LPSSESADAEPKLEPPKQSGVLDGNAPLTLVTEPLLAPSEEIPPAPSMWSEPPSEIEAPPFTPTVDNVGQSITDQSAVSDLVKDVGQPPEPGFRRDHEATPQGAVAAGGKITNGAFRRFGVRLEVVGGPNSGYHYQLERFPVDIGSSAQCDVILGSLQPCQARLIHRNGMFVITNTGVSDDPSTKAWMILQDGDEFHVGPHKLRFNLVSG
jgi:hypothetical protein